MAHIVSVTDEGGTWAERFTIVIEHNGLRVEAFMVDKQVELADGADAAFVRFLEKSKDLHRAIGHGVYKHWKVDEEGRPV
jgi:hypothetical protein